MTIPVDPMHIFVPSRPGVQVPCNTPVLRDKSAHGKQGLVFLQNMWVRDPARVRALIEKHGEDYRLRLIHYSLFAGCLTGRRLKKAFGDELLDTLIFEEASREVHGDHKTIGKPDLTHISTVLEQYQPKVVLTFGVLASDAVSSVYCQSPWLKPPTLVGDFDFSVLTVLRV